MATRSIVFNACTRCCAKRWTPGRPTASAWPPRWPTRTTCAGSPRSTIRRTADCATCGKSPSPVAGASERCRMCTGTASATTAGCPRSGRPDQGRRLRRRDSYPRAAARRYRRAATQDPRPLLRSAWSPLRRRRTPPPGEGPDQPPQPRQHRRSYLPVVHGPFRDWITEVDLGHCVPHQARHTLATSNYRP